MTFFPRLAHWHVWPVKRARAARIWLGLPVIEGRLILGGGGGVRVWCLVSVSLPFAAFGLLLLRFWLRSPRFLVPRSERELDTSLDGCAKDGSVIGFGCQFLTTLSEIIKSDVLGSWEDGRLGGV